MVDFPAPVAPTIATVSPGFYFEIYYLSELLAFRHKKILHFGILSFLRYGLF